MRINKMNGKPYEQCISKTSDYFQNKGIKVDMKRFQIMDIFYQYCIDLGNEFLKNQKAGKYSKPTTRKRAFMYWEKNDVIYRDEKDPKTGFTLPSYVTKTTQEWIRAGRITRDEKDPVTGLTLPALIDTTNGILEWYKDGKQHMDEKDPVMLAQGISVTLPARVHIDGLKEWILNGKHDRYDKDPETELFLPTIIGREFKAWYKDGKPHRDEKDPDMLARGISITLPAYIDNYGREEWYKDGKKHRVDRDPETGMILPAVIINYNGNRTKEWWVNGNKIPEPRYIPLIPFVSAKESCNGEKASPYSHEEWDEIEDKRNILVLPDAKNPTLYYCYSRDDVIRWWKGQPNNAILTTKALLTDHQKDIIRRFMDDYGFFD